ncbi:REP element-mobilizing transposase RayT [Ilumatobacter fluminis]|uniref:REP element-mobilizing transposase RayT n=1 Tax=Ilumatobacter fluminis TaxID=467091 RepID=A0A4R7I587_9ACTN|nr:transposase [Ilumatobacter fluminis]TDT18520.1 REP element-mobilizing transposase RayT [Ilumatobacter fluminis]
MARTGRFSPTGWFHIMNRGVASQPVVRDDADRRKLLATLEMALAQTEASVHAYCVMTNHYHFIVEASADQLGRLMKGFAQRYSQAFNKRHGRIGPVFAGRYHDVPIAGDVQLIATIRYVALNPVAIDRYDIDRYGWSSHGAIVTGHQPPWLTSDVVDLFGGSDGYRRFIDDGRSDAEQIVEMARLAIDEVRGMRSSRDRDVRDIVLLLADRAEATLSQTLIRELGFASAENERTARHRARRRTDELGPVVDRLRAVLEYSTEVAGPGSGDRR